MRNEGKTPIQIIQELLAVLSTRKEACEELSGRSDDSELRNELTSRVDQTNRFIDELTAELSLFGDAVTSEVDRKNEYLVMWTNSKATEDSARMKHTFFEMESALVRIYEEADDTVAELPDTLKEIVHRQRQEVTENIK